jgi:hypothetical protein
MKRWFKLVLSVSVALASTGRTSIQAYQKSTMDPKQRSKPPIFNLILSDILGPEKKIKMLFVTAEKSRQTEVSSIQCMMVPPMNIPMEP